MYSTVYEKYFPDYDLALRDGRMLESLAHLPRRTKLSLRNYLTRRYPAVPIPSAVLKRAKEVQSKKDYDSDLNNEADCIDAGDDLTYIGKFYCNIDSRQ